jgi:simple sugar transport system permease protein
VNDNVWVVALAAAVSVGTPLTLAAVGEILAERAGVLNLGLEGMMLLGAVCAFLAADAWHDPWLALLCGIVAGAALSLVHAFLSITLRANQIVSGLALVIFGTGLAEFLGQPVEGDRRGASFVAVHMSGLHDLPIVGPVAFGQNVLVYVTVAVVAVAAFYLRRTRAGLALRAVGESPETADARGIRVARVRYVHVLLGCVLAGFGGAYQALARVPSWSQAATTNGIGWIALALVVFASWKPWRALAGALVFGFALRANFTLQAADITFVPAEFLSMLPYVLTVLVLVALSFGDLRSRAGAPAALGVPYVRDER